MRELIKLEEPDVLKKNAKTWLNEYLQDKSNNTKKYKYRHKEIKETLKLETGNKCVYCESKIGHNTPGDIEHKIPSSKGGEFHFCWTNLTLACTECNRRKNDYYTQGEEFLDPYFDDVESILEHYGPVVLWQSGHKRAEISIRILELNSYNRIELICRKIEKIEELNNLIERYYVERNELLKKLIKKKFEEMSDKKAEFSGMVRSILVKKGIITTGIIYKKG